MENEKQWYIYIYRNRKSVATFYASRLRENFNPDWAPEFRVKVIEFSEYEKAVKALKKIRELYIHGESGVVDAMDINAMSALKELGELDPEF